ncbi:MAG TPA: YqgE/AlgH family protein [Candidatus Limnocylindria bacterium]|jgi:putative transcriptional regulator|nr:YqgE/AlgH family protein [Candidatus Limnocylindria bacterium]
MAKGKKFFSLKAQLLLDGGNLQGSYFHRTVVLVCEHTPEGAVGLVLNRPSENALNQVFNQSIPQRLESERLFLGGPVQTAALSFLYSNAVLLTGNITTNLSMSHELDDLIGIGEEWVPSQKLRVFAGYSGWGAGQLEDEIRRDAWLIHAATLDLVFDVAPEQLWQQILRGREDWRERLLAESPDDPAAN